METNTGKKYDLRAFGIRACGELWARATDAWCEVCLFSDTCGAIDLCFLACGFGIVTDGRRRRVVYGGSAWCGASSGRRGESAMLSGGSRLYCMRLGPPGRGAGWCGLDPETAMRAWRMLKSQVTARPRPVSPELEAGWQELLAKLEAPDAGNASAMVCMAFGSIVSRSLDEMVRPPSLARNAKSTECVLAYLESCTMRNFPSIEKLAARLGYCAGHLMMSFRASFGVTLKHCMDMIRCEHAVRLIGEGESVQAVAAACGFGGWVAFRKTFARVFGMSVNDYRRRIGVKAKCA